MPLTEDIVIDAIRAFTPLSVQSREEAAAGENTTAQLLYSSSSRTQGNFSMFYRIASRKLEKDIARYGVPLSDDEQAQAIAYLIWDLAIKKFPDWDAKEVSIGSERVSRSRPGVSSALAAYQDLLRSRSTWGTFTADIGLVDDFANYPQSMHPAPMNSILLRDEPD